MTEMSISFDANTGIVFDIQRFAIHDGPGIRTNVFLKGCPLRCIWCHNPESYSIVPDIFYDEQKCIGCGACAAQCPQKCHHIAENAHLYDRQECVRCGLCAEACPTNAVEMRGKRMTVEQVIQEVLKEKSFYRDHGGMTVSGGEPLFQPEFTLNLVKSAKDNRLHVAVETCGFCKPDALEKLIPYVDLFLYDMKETDPERHQRFTGVSPELIWKNLELLNSAGAAVILRCPLIPGYNDREDHLSGIARWANLLSCVKEINIEPYHNLGASKRARLGAEAQPEIQTPDADTINQWLRFLADRAACRVRRA